MIRVPLEILNVSGEGERDEGVRGGGGSEEEVRGRDEENRRGEAGKRDRGRERRGGVKEGGREGGRLGGRVGRSGRIK